jgi:4-alpha-glucanotransferase
MALTLPSELEQLAELCGVQCAYEDALKQRRPASVDSLLAALAALETGVSSLADVPTALVAQRTARLERGIEPVVVAWESQPIEFDLTQPVRGGANRVDVHIESEDQGPSLAETIDLKPLVAHKSPCGRFATRRVKLRQPVPCGYHRMYLRGDSVSPTDGSTELASLLISAPVRAYEDPAQQNTEWGCFVPLYALRSERNWGAGDLTDLRDLAAWSNELGARVTGTLPLLAAFLDEPFEPSPYAPATRLAWNEFYIDVTAVPELKECPAALAMVSSPEAVEATAVLRASEHVDYRRVMAAKRRVLEVLAADFFSRAASPRHDEFKQFIDQHPYVEDYAAFRAVGEQRRESWQQWPRSMRDGTISDRDVDLRLKQYHMYVQWIATEQLESLAHDMDGGLYLDLPLGVRSDGYDVWRWRDAYACGATAGSPPDPVWTKGQNWCFPPLHPERIRQQGYQHVRDYLSHHFRIARMLRIDHVMQLHRLFWIPNGMDATQGVYVRYRPEEFYAILNLESHRHRTMLIGENLGTVPREVDQAMDRHGMKRMYVVQYEVAGGNDPDPSAAIVAQPSSESKVASQNHSARLSKVPAGALASLNTHDMPTFAAWWNKLDFPVRQQLGLVSETDARLEMEQFDKTKKGLLEWLDAGRWIAGPQREDVDVLSALLHYIAASDAGVVMVNLEDLWLETEPQNVPGTGPELPNWKRKVAKTTDELTRSAQVRSILTAVAEWRQQSQLAKERHKRA